MYQGGLVLDMYFFVSLSHDILLKSHNSVAQNLVVAFAFMLITSLFVFHI
jgi:hypothetical protein